MSEEQRAEKLIDYINENSNLNEVSQDLIENIVYYGFAYWGDKSEKDDLFEYLDHMLCYSKIGIEPEEIRKFVN